MTDRRLAALTSVLETETTRRTALGRLAGVAALLGVRSTAAPLIAAAQEATPVTGASPVASPTVPGEIVAQGLTNPRGFTWSSDGTLYVALAGNGGTSAGVVKIENGTATAVVDGLPSDVSDQGSVEGVADVAFLGDDLYLLLEGAGPGHKAPETPTGVYKVGADGKPTLVADLSTWVKDNPTAEVPDHEPYGNPYKLLAGEDQLWVLIATPDQVVTVKPDGTITRFVDLTKDGGHQVRTGIAAAPDGTLYVSALSPFPYEDGTTKVTKIAADGTFSDAWTGLTAVTDVAVGQDGTLYALELSTNNTPKTVMTPGTGKLVHQTGPATSEDVVTGLTAPIAMRFGADGQLYVASPAVGADHGEGTIVKVATS